MDDERKDLSPGEIGLKLHPSERARELRRRQTDAERKLWSVLRNRGVGAKFRRQHPVAGYIVDFCCPGHNLIVEIDGQQHGEAKHMASDCRRDEVLRGLGFRILRITNREALTETESIRERIYTLLASPSPGLRPTSPFGRGTIL